MPAVDECIGGRKHFQKIKAFNIFSDTLLCSQLYGDRILPEKGKAAMSGARVIEIDDLANSGRVQKESRNLFAEREH